MNKYTNKQRPYRAGSVRRRKNLIKQYVALGIAVLLVILLIPRFFSVSANTSEASAYFSSYSVYTVQDGDTVWDIAKDITDKKDDVRKTVYEIKKLNDIKGDQTISPGQRIVLPYK